MNSRRFITPVRTIALAVLVVPVLIQNPYWLNLISLLEIYILVSLGMNLIMGYAGQASLGHGAVYGVGAYTSGILVVDYGCPFFLALPASMAVSGMVGFLLSMISARLQGFYLAMVTIAFAIIFERTLVNFESLTHGAEGLINIPPAFLGSWSLSPVDYYYLIAAVLILGTWITKNLIESDFGRSCVAIHGNQSTAGTLGINVYRLKHQVFFIGCVFAGLGGGLYAHLAQYISPDSFSLEMSFFFSLVVIVGGMGSFWGPFVGAIGLLFLPEMLHVFQEYKMLVYGFLLLACIVLLPKGLVSLPDKIRNKKISETRYDPLRMEPDNFTVSQMPTQAGREILRISGLSKSFGELTALDQVSFGVRQGSIHGLIGPNGSGKTTLVNTISSTYKPDKGQIYFNDRDVTYLPSYKIAQLGISRTFQKISIYPDLTVLDNILIGHHASQQTGTFSKAFDLPRSRRDERRMRKQATRSAALVGLEGQLLTPAGELGHNQKRFMEIARALSLNPALILLDEPGAGLSGEELLFLRKLILRLRDMNISILLIEHHVEFVIDVSDVITVLNYGVKIAEGPPAEITRNPAVLEAYLGFSEEANA